MASKLFPAGPEDCSFFKLIGKIFPFKSNREPAHRLFSTLRQLGVTHGISDEATELPSDELRRVNQEINAISKRLLGAGKKLPAAVVKYSFFSTPTIPLRAESDADKFLEHVQTLDSYPDRYLGYVIFLRFDLPNVLKKKGVAYLFESVIRKNDIPQFRAADKYSSLHTSNLFVHVVQQFNCWCGKLAFRVEGSYFCQSNHITTVCAHASMAMAINNSKSGALVSCEDVNEALEINHLGGNAFKVGSDLVNDDAYSKINSEALLDGLLPSQMKVGLEKMSVRCALYEGVSRPDNWNDTRIQTYGVIESGRPCILLLRGTESDDVSHAVCVVGHTLDGHRWLGNVFYLPNSGTDWVTTNLRWVNAFVIHDDVTGMRSTFSTHLLPEGRIEERIQLPDYGKGADRVAASSKRGIFETLIVDALIDILPSNPAAISNATWIHCLASNALTKFLDYSLDEKNIAIFPEFETNYSLNRLQWIFKRSLDSTCLLRCLYITKRQYLSHLKSLETIHSSPEKLSEDDLRFIEESISDSDCVWIAELSEPHLYVANSSKIGEVVIVGANRPDADWSNDCSKNNEATKELETFGLRTVRLIRLPSLLIRPDKKDVKSAPAIHSTKLSTKVPLYRRDDNI